jgi:hypothetical protein
LTQATTAIQSDPFLAPKDMFTISIIGAMNPAIHHPAWYRFVGVLSAEEAATVPAPPPIQVPPGSGVQIFPLEVFCSTQFAQFTIRDLRVTCLPSSWTVTTIDPSGLDRIKDVAAAVFDALAQTPVSGYSLGFHHHRETRLSNVGEYMVRTASALPYGLMRVAGAEDSLQLRYIARSTDRDLVVDLQPSAKAKEMIYLAVNITHTVQPTKELAPFDLRPLLEAAVAEDNVEAQAWLGSVLQRLQSSAE